MSEMCRTRLAENAGRKNDAKNRHLRSIDNFLSGHIFGTKAHIDNRKKMLNSNISSTCPHNMVNFGTRAAEIVSWVGAPLQISTGFAS